jgi:hypothetical protein
LKFAIGIKALAFSLGVTYIIVDHKKLGKGMTMTKKQRQKRELEIENAIRDLLTKRAVKPTITYSGLGLLCAMVITAWVVFIKYLI